MINERVAIDCVKKKKCDGAKKKKKTQKMRLWAAVVDDRVAVAGWL
jgi:hypothetical protein